MKLSAANTIILTGIIIIVITAVMNAFYLRKELFVDLSPSDGVTVFYHCGFNGQNRTFGVGKYTSDKLGLPHPTENTLARQISSVKVPKWFYIILYSNPDLTGESIRIEGNVDCLVGMNWNDKAQSFEVNNFTAILFEHCNYTGNVLRCMGQGRFDNALLSKFNLQTTISSIQVCPGYEVILYNGPNCNGESYSITKDIACLTTIKLGSSSWNDNVRSIEIRAITPLLQLYETCNYNGPEARLQESGTVDLKNIKVSSIRVQDGYIATLYDQANAQGNTLITTKNIDCLVNTPLAKGGGNWDDRALSINVQKFVPAAFFYTACDYGQDSSARPEGTFNQSSLGIPPNTMSSIKVTPGFEVLIYSSPDATGQFTVVSQDTPCLVNLAMPIGTDGNWNDRVNSVTIQKTKEVTLYADVNYSGNSVKKVPGKYPLSQTGLVGNNNATTISSIKVTAGYAVRLFKNTDCTGTSVLIANSVASLQTIPLNSSSNWNDAAGSFEVVRLNEVAIFYDDIDFKGNATRLTVGNHSTLKSSNIKSFKVYPGYKITFYDKTNFQGQQTEEIKGSLSTLKELTVVNGQGKKVDFNAKIRSMKIEEDKK